MTEAAIQQIEVDGKTKFSLSYPLTDESGQPLLDRNGQPRLTNLVGDTEQEVVTKLVNSNLQVAQALERSNRHIETLKNKKPTPRQTAPDLKAKELTADERMQAGLDLQDPRKAAAVIEKVIESRVAPVAAEVERRGKQVDLATRKTIARDFIVAHRADYAPLDANNAILNQYLEAHELEFSIDNLEIALAACQGQLARIVVPAAAPPRNDPPPDNDAPGNEPPNPGNPPPPQRRAPVGGIRDSQASGRPGASDVLTRDQALHMLKHEPSKYEAWMRDPKKNAVLNRALAGR